MALNAFTIYSHPEPIKESKISDLSPELDEGAQGPSSKPLVRIPNNFVSAKGDYDEFGRLTGTPEVAIDVNAKDMGSRARIGDWYSSLQRTQTPATLTSAPRSQSPHTSHSRSTAPTASTSHAAHTTNWFKPLVPDLQNTPTADSLAEMLKRDPPDSQNPLIPPVHYALGPQNRGYEMLTKGGWEEGQPLGPTSKRTQRPSSEATSSSYMKKEKWATLTGDMPKLVLRDEHDGSTLLVDITNAEEDDEEESETSDEEENNGLFSADDPTQEETGMIVDARQDGRSQDKAILTPIPVVLKNDRTGLGLTKKKRLVTHSSLALRHHIQQGKLERRNHATEARQMERDYMRGMYGRGKRAYARKAAAEQEKRKRIRELMNS